GRGDPYSHLGTYYRRWARGRFAWQRRHRKPEDHQGRTLRPGNGEPAREADDFGQQHRLVLPGRVLGERPEQPGSRSVLVVRERKWNRWDEYHKVAAANQVANQRH